MKKKLYVVVLIYTAALCRPQWKATWG